MGKVISEAAAETLLLLAKLSQMTPGTMLRYGELSAVVAGDVQRERAHNLASAIRICEREYGLLFGRVRGEGVRCLTPSEAVSIGPAAIRSAGRKARRTVKRMSLIEYDKLSAEERRRHDTEFSLLALVGALTTTRRVKQLAAAVAVSQKKLPVAKTLEAFQAGNGQGAK